MESVEARREEAAAGPEEAGQQGGAQEAAPEGAQQEEEAGQQGGAQEASPEGAQQEEEAGQQGGAQEASPEGAQQEEEAGQPPRLLFRKWSLEGIEIVDPGLKTAISLRQTVVPHTYGRSALKRFNKADVNIVERLVNKLMHFGKKYAKNTGRMTGKKISVTNTVKAAFEIIHLKTGKNPVEVLVRAVENSAPNEDTTRIVYGGTVYHVSVDVSPIRRVDLALRFIADGVKEATFSNPKAVEEYLAEHLVLAASSDQGAPSVKKKHELERIAQASR